MHVIIAKKFELELINNKWLQYDSILDQITNLLTLRGIKGLDTLGRRNKPSGYRTVRGPKPNIQPVNTPMAALARKKRMYHIHLDNGGTSSVDNLIVGEHVLHYQRISAAAVRLIGITDHPPSSRSNMMTANTPNLPQSKPRNKRILLPA